MRHGQQVVRDDALADALRAANDAIGEQVPTEQALKIIDAIKRLRVGWPLQAANIARIDYTEIVTREARAHWAALNMNNSLVEDQVPAFASTGTPLGKLTVEVWKRRWRTGRIAWASEYSLRNEPITIAEIRAAGLAQRPTTRKRKNQQ